MSKSPIRRRVAAAVLLSALSLVAASGCTGRQRDASNYADTEGDFMQGCVSQAEADNAAIADGADGTQGATQIKDPKGYCQCVFDTISGKDGVPFDQFKSINSDLRDNGGPLPESFQKAYDSCQPTATFGG